MDTKAKEKLFREAGEREADLRALDELIVKSAPSLKPFMLPMYSKPMLAYGKYHYRYASGREGDWAVVALANQKNYISVYVCMAKDGKYLAEANKDKLGKVSVGKSCIRFKKLEDLDTDALKKVLKEAEALSKDTSNFQM